MEELIFYLVVIALAFWLIGQVFEGLDALLLSIPWTPIFIGIVVFASVVLFLKVTNLLQRKLDKKRRNKEWEKSNPQHIMRGVDYARYIEKNKQNDCLNKIIAINDEAINIFTSITENLRNSEGWINKAENDFSVHALAPFWNSVEYTGYIIALTKGQIEKLKGVSTRYIELLPHYNDTPPPFPTTQRSIQQLGDTLEIVNSQLKGIVQNAQRSYDFTSIYYQRQTNRLLTEGLTRQTDLIEAINEASFDIIRSINDLHNTSEKLASVFNRSVQTIESSILDISEENIAHRKTISAYTVEAEKKQEKALEMLDNIQNKRKPYPY